MVSSFLVAYSAVALFFEACSFMYMKYINAKYTFPTGSF